MWDQFCQNRLNGIKNMVSMVQLATHNAIPGLSTANDRFYHKLFKWPVRVFSATSVSPTSWLVVMRRQLLEIYKDLHDAIAKYVSFYSCCLFRRTYQRILEMIQKK
jgi:hypothetical protein